MKMSGNSGLLDTNIIIDIFSGNSRIADRVNKLEQLFINTIVLGELFIGINRVNNKSKHLKKLETFLKLCTVLDVDPDTSRYFGEIVAMLHRKGKPIPTNDVWIAASAMQHNLQLLTSDNHFKEIEGLSLQYF